MLMAASILTSAAPTRSSAMMAMPAVAASSSRSNAFSFRNNGSKAGCFPQGSGPVSAKQQDTPSGQRPQQQLVTTGPKEYICVLTLPLSPSLEVSGSPFRHPAGARPSVFVPASAPAQGMEPLPGWVSDFTVLSANAFRQGALPMTISMPAELIPHGSGGLLNAAVSHSASWGDDRTSLAPGADYVVEVGVQTRMRWYVRVTDR